ncbi:uncharacterized protein BO80DRAFT_448921 [Aspergillus ibericus CBS 121593]|uniref:Uncharacterized protein n=1 Tax=Aspergillus ibericus CBS 121593 TaxID=1448316 RepID=A0A395GMZ8_9EURO|nr:hypothetical protein BO80DRAFT_448921 [Aspergillus ibericus CBS 121593]RAK96754.1 hypothetical protein BO80DRAFT_448921 [Aspergillus ibericus CBS 121593]
MSSSPDQVPKDQPLCHENLSVLAKSLCDRIRNDILRNGRYGYLDLHSIPAGVGYPLAKRLCDSHAEITTYNSLNCMFSLKSPGWVHKAAYSWLLNEHHKARDNGFLTESENMENPLFDRPTFDGFPAPYEKTYKRSDCCIRPSSGGTMPSIVMETGGFGTSYECLLSDKNL